MISGRNSGDLKVSVSGVRGIVGRSLTPALAAGFTAAFGEFVGGGKVVVGRDTRRSGEMIEYAVVASLLAAGCQPVLAGIVPTPTLQILVGQQQANGGIMISASHNPMEWNALKFIGADGIFLNDVESGQLLDLYNQPERRYAEEADYRRVRTLEDPFAPHQEKIFRHVDVAAIRRCHFKVAADCCNGAAALYTRKFLTALGCEVLTINDQPDGIFRRNPEPTPANLTELSRVVRENSCAIGFAQDPDADRIGLVDNRGNPVSEQYALVMAADHILSDKPGRVAVNLQTTKAVEDVARSYGCETYYTKVGEINVTEKMLQCKAVIGGEGNSGGIIYPAVHPCRDSFTAMALLLEMLALSCDTVDNILASLPRYYSAGRKYACPANRARLLIRTLKQRYADRQPITADGIRINLERGWVLIRPSNTESVLRLIVEAASPTEAQQLLEEFDREINRQLTPTEKT